MRGHKIILSDGTQYAKIKELKGVKLPKEVTQNAREHAAWKEIGTIYANNTMYQLKDVTAYQFGDILVFPVSHITRRDAQAIIGLLQKTYNNKAFFFFSADKSKLYGRKIAVTLPSAMFVHIALVPFLAPFATKAIKNEVRKRWKYVRYKNYKFYVSGRLAPSRLFDLKQKFTVESLIESETNRLEVCKMHIQMQQNYNFIKNETFYAFWQPMSCDQWLATDYTIEQHIREMLTLMPLRKTVEMYKQPCNISIQKRVQEWYRFFGIDYKNEGGR